MWTRPAVVKRLSDCGFIYLYQIISLFSSTVACNTSTPMIIHSVGDRTLVKGVVTITLSQGKVLE